MLAFDGNDYRKRVLAPVHRRGGPESSDAFELYDLPLDEAERLGDGEVATRIAEVWAFWQRQRDHPKYGTLVGLLVEDHDTRAPELLDRFRRVALAQRIRSGRDERDAARFELLDQAIRRLVERHHGIPRDKVDGLVELGAQGGLTEAEVRGRLQRHRFVDATPIPPRPAAPSGPAVSDHRRQQVRDLLDEFGRLNETPAPPTLLALLGLDPRAPDGEIRLRADAWRARCRELPPIRMRAVADELLVHVGALLESGPDVREAYLDAVAEDVTVKLRPRVRAAILVEDRLVADDHEHLLEEAQYLGLDAARGRRVLAAIAAELGAEVEDTPRAAPATPPRPDHSRPGHLRPWDDPLRAARAALRRGELVLARRLVGEARARSDAHGATPIRAVSDEIDDAIREAELRWRAVATALGARRFAEAVEHLEQLCRTATDVPGPAGAGRAGHELERARAEVAQADAAVAQATAASDPLSGLLTVLARWPQHPAAVAALAVMPLHPPRDVRAVRDRTGAVVVTWQPSATAGVGYRIARLQADGSTRVVGRTASTRVEDGGAPAGAIVPDYIVVATQEGRSSTEARTGVLAASPAPAAAPAPSDVRAVRSPSGSVVVTWDGPTGAEFKISRRTADGRWQVLGRTRGLSIEDGGAGSSGPPPVYRVIAMLAGTVSSEACSAG